MIVYKYLPPSRTDVIEDNLIRFTQSASLNDPFETAPSIEGLKLAFRRHAIRMIENERFSPLEYGVARLKIEAQIDKHLTHFHRRNSVSDYAILSLSKIRNNLLMWAHYCDSHRGFVLGFDSTHTFF